MRDTKRWLACVAPLLWSLYVAWPARGWGWLEGVPLGAVSTLALSAVWWLWWTGLRLPAWRIAVCFLLLKAGGASLLTERGLTARYFANEHSQPPVERSVDYRRQPYTRIDARLLFGPSEAQDLPLFFFNDFTRFNFYRPDEPARPALPFSVEWTGQFLVEPDETAQVFLGGDVRGRVIVDGRVALSHDPSERAAATEDVRQLLLNALHAGYGDNATATDDQLRTFAAAYGVTNFSAQSAAPLAAHLQNRDDERRWRPVFGGTSGFSRTVATIALSRGWHQVVIAIQAPYAAGRSTISAGLIDRAGVGRPFDEQRMYVRRPSPWQLSADRLVRRASPFVDALVIVGLAFGILAGLVTALTRPTVASAALFASVGAIAEAYRFAQPWLGRVMPLGGGDDMLTYETFARDILLNGPLMTMGRPVGSGEAFYYQPLYPYALALLHAVFGEGYFGIVFVQRLLVAVTVGLVWQVAHRLFGKGAGVTAACLAAAVLYAKLGPWAAVLLGEIVFVPLVCAWAALSIGLASDDRGAWWRAGLVGGVATLSRSTLLLAWPPIAVVASAALMAARRKILPVVASVALMTAVLGLATARNWIVSHTFVAVTTSFPTNFRIGNGPPPGVPVPVHFVSEHRFYEWFARDDRTRMAIEFARHAPRAFARNLLNKALYTLGFFDAYVDGAGWSPLYVCVWVSALAGALILGIRGAPYGPATLAHWIPAVIAASHFAAVTLIFPNTYGDRLILPFYALILPYSALTLWTARRSAGAGREPRDRKRSRGPVNGHRGRQAGRVEAGKSARDVATAELPVTLV